MEISEVHKKVQAELEDNVSATCVSAVAHLLPKSTRVISLCCNFFGSSYFQTVH